MENKKSTHFHSFKAKGDRAYFFAMKAPKSPLEAREENAAPGFVIAMPEDSTLQDLHNYICRLLDRKIKDFYFRFKSNEDSNESDEDEKQNSAKDEEVKYRYYVPSHMLEENSEYNDANIQIRILGLKEKSEFGYRLKVTGADWQSISMVHITPMLPDQEYPTSVRIVARVSQVVDPNDASKSKTHTADDHIVIDKRKDGPSEAEEEIFVSEMHQAMSSFFPTSLTNVIFMLTCIGVMEYLRLHKLINFGSAKDRQDWTASILYTSLLINADDPEFTYDKVDINQICKHYNVDEQTIMTHHAEALKCLKEENIQLKDLSMSVIINNPLLKNQIAGFKEIFGHKSGKIHHFRNK